MGLKLKEDFEIKCFIQKIIAIHQKIPHCRSFPTIYSNMGLKLKEDYKKNVLSKKITVFLLFPCQNFQLPQFSLLLSTIFC